MKKYVTLISILLLRGCLIFGQDTCSVNCAVVIRQGMTIDTVLSDGYTCAMWNDTKYAPCKIELKRTYDTIQVKLLIGVLDDTIQQHYVLNTYPVYQNVYPVFWINGYEVIENHIESEMTYTRTGNHPITIIHKKYLDFGKEDLQKNIIVWQAQ